MTFGYSSFLVRWWRVGRLERRIEVQHIQSGSRTRVATMAAALDWMTARSGEPNEPSELDPLSKLGKPGDLGDLGELGDAGEPPYSAPATAPEAAPDAAQTRQPEVPMKT